MVQNNQLSLTWLVQSTSRDKRFIPVRIGLTQGLIGQRILLSPLGEQHSYAAINSLEQFRASGKIGGFGSSWFDIDVWRLNQLPYYARDGEWRRLFHMLSPKGGVNYLSRGLTEVVGDAKLNPHLAIEPRLLFIYDRDFQFYLAPSVAKYQALLEQALKKRSKAG